jgi:hypothetical protein
MPVNRKLVTEVSKLFKNFNEAESKDQPAIAKKIAEKMPEMNAESQAYLKKTETNLESTVAALESITQHPLFNLNLSDSLDSSVDTEERDALMAKWRAEGNKVKKEMSPVQTIVQQAYEWADLDKKYQAVKKAFPSKEPQEDETERLIAEEEPKSEEEVNDYIDEDGNWIGPLEDLIDMDESQEEINKQEKLYRQLLKEKQPKDSQDPEPHVSVVKSFDEQFTVWQDLACRWENFKKKVQDEIEALVGRDREKALRNEPTRKILKELTLILKSVFECIATCRKWINSFADRKSLSVSQSDATQSSKENENLDSRYKKLQEAEIDRDKTQKELLNNLKEHKSHLKATHLQKSLEQKNNYIDGLKARIKITENLQEVNKPTHKI